jgi:hypothetical protein
MDTILEILPTVRAPPVKAVEIFSNRHSVTSNCDAFPTKIAPPDVVLTAKFLKVTFDKVIFVFVEPRI